MTSVMAVYIARAIIDTKFTAITRCALGSTSTNEA
jgi:hypothetical protein